MAQARSRQLFDRLDALEERHVAAPRRPWYLDRPLLLELFATVNLAFLTLDIYVAHSVNEFHHPAEWIPLVFSALGAAALVLGLLQSERFDRGTPRWIGLSVGWGAVAVGLAGLLLHLESQFFEVLTLRRLIYSAPFVAPLAFTGVGLLLVMNRTVDHREKEWGYWVVFLALAGVMGNFGLSVIDHAQNAFFYATEWIPVVVAALGVGVLLLPFFRPVDRPFALWALAVMALQVATGLLGFYFHLRTGLTGSADVLMENIIYGAPIFAPLLFCNLPLLALIGLWDLYAKDVLRERVAG